MEDRGTNFALLAIVAIVAIAALVILLKGGSASAPVNSPTQNVAGQMMKISEGDGCKLNQDGECSGSCETGRCRATGDSCKCS